MKLLFVFILLLIQWFQIHFLHAKTENFASLQLEKIATDHHNFLQSVKNASYSESELRRLCEDVLKGYENFITHNPDCVEAYTLYGKLLRMVGEKPKAHAAFVKANKLNPHIAVVKQQIANYLTETGNYGLALAYILQAIELSPKESQYHYQLGEILYTYKDDFLRENILTPEAFDTQMLSAFEKAKILNPTERVLALRYAEAFYDLCTSQWQQALGEWEKLESSAPNPLDQQIIYLHKARVLILLNQFEAAKACLAAVNDSKLQPLKNQVASDLPNQSVDTATSNTHT